MGNTGMVNGDERLDAEGIAARARADCPGQSLRVEVVDSIASTNESLLRRVAGGEDIHGLALLAEQQSAGRGRRGRQWLSPPGGNLYLSFGWRLALESLDGLSLVAGIAVTRALRNRCAAAPRLKWPNDILVDGRKLGGILVELHLLPGAEACAVIGIGLNLRLPADILAAIDQPVTDLATVAVQPFGRNALAGAIVAELANSLLQFGRESLEAFRGQWDAVDALRGQEVETIGGGEVLQGTVIGIDGQGALLVATSGGIRPVIAGDVSVRRRV